MVLVKVFACRLVSVIVKAVVLEDVHLLVQDALLGVLVDAPDVQRLVMQDVHQLAEVLVLANVLLVVLAVAATVLEDVTVVALDVALVVRMDVLQDVLEDAVILVRVSPT